MAKKIQDHKIFGIYTDFKGRTLFTKSLPKPAISHFGERIVRQGSDEYREWEAKHSTLAATVMNKCSNTGIREGSSVLYLGASHGYTPSFVSDLIGKDGFLFALDFSPDVVRDLVFLSEKRSNIAPIIADANHPEKYMDRVSQVDVVFQDIAQRNQAEIFLKNCRIFLKDKGYGLLSVKAKSIDIKRKSSEIFQEVKEIIGKEFRVVDFRDLAPHEKEHCMIIIKKQEPIVELDQKKITPKKEKPKAFTHRKEGNRNKDYRGNKNNKGSRDGKSYNRSYSRDEHSGNRKSDGRNTNKRFSRKD